INLTQRAVGPGTVVRYLWGADAWGTVTYTEFPIAAVVNDHQLKLATGNTAAVPTPSKVEVWLPYSAANVTAELQGRAGSHYGDDRACVVWPDVVTFVDGNTTSGFFLAAYLAGIRRGCAPHRCLRDVALPHVASVPRTTSFLTPAQVRALGTHRVWVV